MNGWRHDRWNVGAFQFLFDSQVGPLNGLIFMFDQTFPRWLVAVSPQKPRRHPRAANNVAFAVLRLRVLRVCVQHCRSSDAVRLTVLGSVLQGMLHLFSVAVLFLPSRSAWPADCWLLDCILITFGWLLLHAQQCLKGNCKSGASHISYWSQNSTGTVWFCLRAQTVPVMFHCCVHLRLKGFISDYFTDASLWRACRMRSNCCAHVKVFKAQQCCRTRSQYVCKYVWRSLHECLSAAVVLCETRLSDAHRLVPRRSCLGLGVGLPVSRWQDFLPTFRLGILGRKPVSWLCMACAVLSLSLWLNPIVVGGVQWGDYLHQVIFSCRRTFAPLCTAELDLSKLGKKIFRPILPNLLFRSGMLKALTSVDRRATVTASAFLCSDDGQGKTTYYCCRRRGRENRHHCGKTWLDPIFSPFEWGSSPFKLIGLPGTFTCVGVWSVEQ